MAVASRRRHEKFEPLAQDHGIRRATGVVLKFGLLLAIALVGPPDRAGAQSVSVAPTQAAVTAGGAPPAGARVDDPTSVSAPAAGQQSTAPSLPAPGADRGAGTPAAVAAPAQRAAATQESTMSQSLVVLAQIFLIAVLLEQALAVIFNWRLFLSTFNARGVKTIVAVLAAWWLVSVLDLDLVAKLLRTYGTDAKDGALSTSLLTAFILAGGSSGVNNLLVALGFRSMRTAEQIAPRPPKTEAWIAVRLVRDKAVGSVTVSIGPAGSAALPVAGIIAGASPRNRLARLLLVDRGRFPEVAGYAITPQSGTAYLLQLDGRDKAGQPLSAQWGPHALAPGAVIDLELRL